MKWIKRAWMPLLCLLAVLVLTQPIRAEAAETVASGTCGDNLTWALDSEGTLTISGEGEMDHYYDGDAPWYFERTSITHVVLEDGVTSISSWAFYGCSSLTSVTIPETVTSIGGSAFYGCSSLTSVTIPEGVTSIGGWVFYGCSSLASVTIPGSVRSIGEFAFYDCSGRMDVYYVGTETSWNKISVESSNKSLTGAKFHFAESCGENLLWILNDGGILIISGTGNMTDYSSPNQTGRKAPWYKECESVKELVVENGVTNIGYGAFSGCSNLTNVMIRGDLTGIGDWAFSGCSSLVSFTIPGSVTSIGNKVFSGCSNLTGITIPDSVTSMGSGAFGYCNSLTSLTVAEGNRIYYSDGNCIIETDSKTLIAGCYTSVIPSDGSVTSIGDSAFCGCGNLTSVMIPEGVTSIGDDAFSGCGNLTSVTIPGSVSSIGTWAFAHCSSLLSVSIPEGVTSIDGHAFYGCSSLESVTIPGSVRSIGEFAFYGCSSLTNVTIPEGVTSIGVYAFENCSGLRNVMIPEGVTKIEYACFSGCSNLTSITIPEGVTTIEYAAFDSCSSLTNVTIPKSVTNINYAAFCNCSSLTDVYFKGSRRAWERIAIVNENIWLTGATLHLPVPGTCSGSMGMHMVAENKHVCDFCNEIVIECTDTGKNHVCDICGGTVGEHKAADGKHTCDYCGEKVSECADNDKNHKCDVCGTIMGEHKAADGKHTCDYCGKITSDCVDNDLADHNCDICGAKISDCIDEDGDGKCDVCGAEQEKPGTNDLYRISGSGRWDTAIKTADVLKSELGVSKFSSVIVASGNDSADALAGSYLSAVKNAPILLSWGKGGSYAYLDTNNIDYIKNNLVSGGTVYILGGTSAVPTLYENKLSAYNVVRLGGGNRFETNQKILDEAGVAPGSEVLVCTAYNFADSLSASATGKPVLLVYTTEKGKNYGVDDAYLQSLSGCEFTIIGGESAVSAGVEAILQSYGSVDRLAGGNRFETSVMVAERYFTNPDSAVLAYAWNYPDGLCGGALAYAMNAPLILTMDKYESAAKRYVQSTGISSGYILGGTGLISDATVRTIYALDPSTQIPLK